MNPRLFLWAITSALAGFLFGFDTVVISGASVLKWWKILSRPRPAATPDPA